MYSVCNNDNVVKLKDIPEMSVGSPCPVVMSDGHRLLVAFHSATYKENDKCIEDIILVEFICSIFHQFGMPNEEAIEGHPLSQRGLERFTSHRVNNSSLIKRLEEINRVHPYHVPNYYYKKNHFILFFHDEVFECVADNYKLHIFKDEGNMRKVVDEMAKKLRVSELGLFD